jgi:hypothetical protein
VGSTQYSCSQGSGLLPFQLRGLECLGPLIQHAAETSSNRALPLRNPSALAYAPGCEPGLPTSTRPVLLTGTGSLVVLRVHVLHDEGSRGVCCLPLWQGCSPGAWTDFVHVEPDWSQNITTRVNDFSKVNCCWGCDDHQKRT